MERQPFDNYEFHLLPERVRNFGRKVVRVLSLYPNGANTALSTHNHHRGAEMLLDGEPQLPLDWTE